MIGQKVPVETIVRDVEKKPCPPVPVLGHVMWNMRKDDAGEASHETTLPKVRSDVCQDRCRDSQATFSLISCSASDGLSGLSHTSPTGDQFLVLPLQRSG